MAASACTLNVLSIQTLGKFELRLDGQLVELNSRKARALLGYLALSESSGETRERLVGLLWSDSDEERARGSLRQCLREIKTALPPSLFDGFIAERLEISLDRRRLDVDLWNVLNEARAGAAPMRLLDGPELLDGMLQELQTVDEQFGSWLTAKRQAVKDRILRYLEARLHSIEGDNDETTAHARVIMNLDPTHEEACRSLMRALAARGDAAGAQRVYKKLWDVLDEEFDSRPDEQTQDLIAEIKAAIPFSGGTPLPEAGVGPGKPPPARSGAPQAFQTLLSSGSTAVPEMQPQRNSQLVPLPVVARHASGRRPPLGSSSVKLVLTVAPFPLTGASAPAYLLQGFRRELIASLVRFREWVVREPVGALQAHDADEYILEANGLQLDNGIRLSLTLKEVATSDFLWSEIVDLNLATLFDLQRVVVRRIATALNVHLSAGRMTAIAPRPIENLKAYDIWLLGQATILSFDPEKWAKAEAMFRQVIREMPDFAPAYSSLAQLQNGIHFAHPGVMRSRQRAQESLAFARTAVRLDPIDSRSQLALGWSMAMTGHHEPASMHHSLAIELNQNDPWTLMSCGLGCAFRGEYAKANSLADRALSLALTPSPVHWCYQAMIRYLSGDYRGCIVAAPEAEGAFAHASVWKACAMTHLGMKELAGEAAEHFFKVTADQWIKTEPASKSRMTRWFLNAFPIAVDEDWQRLRDDFAAAGAPVDGITRELT